MVCDALLTPLPRVGERIILLSGVFSGVTGTVSNIALDHRFSPGTFLIRADGDDPSRELIVDPQTTIYAKCTGQFVLPQWFPPFTLRECVDLHSVIVAFVDGCIDSSSWRWNSRKYYEVITYSWYRRLPLEPCEVWQMLNIHGVPSSWENEARHRFLEGTELLVYSNGRRPIKKKRLNVKQRHITRLSGKYKYAKNKR